MSDSEIQKLRITIINLQNRMAELENELLFLKTHNFVAQGIKGEQLAVEISGGALSPPGAGYDLAIGKKLKLEVKYSCLQIPNIGSPTKRWQWARPLGWNNYGKDFDLLLLIGEKDKRFLDQYLDDSPYVFFLVPQADVASLMTNNKQMKGAGQITLNTNLATVRAERSLLLIKFMVPAQRIIELEPSVFKKIDKIDTINT